MKTRSHLDCRRSPKLKSAGFRKLTHPAVAVSGLAIDLVAEDKVDQLPAVTTTLRSRCCGFALVCTTLCLLPIIALQCSLVSSTTSVPNLPASALQCGVNRSL